MSFTLICNAKKAPFILGKSMVLIKIVTIGQKTNWNKIGGGDSRPSVNNIEGITMCPTIKIVQYAGPSSVL